MENLLAESHLSLVPVTEAQSEMEQVQVWETGFA
jgi:hypothetical protein